MLSSSAFKFEMRRYTEALRQLLERRETQMRWGSAA
jgi:hypothetical protein